MPYGDLIKAIGYGAGSLGGGAAIHGGLSSVLSPLDFPRQALANAIAAPGRFSESGNWSDLLGMLPAVGGGLSSLLISPMGGAMVAGALQGLGNATGHEAFNAPSVEDITGSDNPMLNMIVGMGTDPLTLAGGLGAFKHSAKAAGGAVAEALAGAAKRKELLGLTATADALNPFDKIGRGIKTLAQEPSQAIMSGMPNRGF